MNVRFASLLMTLVIAFIYLVVLTRGHLTVIPH
ncbi:MAG: hypothetical protein QOF06_1982 [Solirubrobacterales bacterium]|jgi:hypothetical protein|nr:hypothetical protein [Solirubrobacterales bacterium]